MKSYNFNLNEKHNLIRENSNLLSRELRKQIGNYLFTTYKIYKDKDDDFFIAKKIYESIFRYQDNDELSFLGLNLNHKL